MTLGELKELIAKDEGETVEVKESTGQRRDACETLCAFLNKNGGTVVFGVKKKGKLTGQLMADTTKRDLFDAFQKFEPAADIEVSYVPVDETHTAIVCHVDAGNRKPYIYDGKPHKRVQSSTTKMSQEEYERMDAAIAFCFKHLNLAAWTSGKIERDEELEIPADALREALVNAFAHRSYENRRQTIYLAIYDDRVEIKNPGSFPPNFDLTRLYSPPIQHSEPRNEKIAHVLYLRKSIETWGRGLTRIADECNRVGLPVPEVKEEYGCVTTVFKRPDWTGGNTPDQRTGIVAARTGTDTARTGTTHRLSGAAWAITGTTGTAGVEDILARLPKLRKDARANVETVLHELIADKDATIPKICARTGMALRTINNALATLRGAGILKARGNGIVGDCEGERAKRQSIKSEGQPIEGEKPHIGSRKPHIGSEKPHIGDENRQLNQENRQLRTWH